MSSRLRRARVFIAALNSHPSGWRQVARHPRSTLRLMWQWRNLGGGPGQSRLPMTSVSGKSMAPTAPLLLWCLLQTLVPPSQSRETALTGLRGLLTKQERTSHKDAE